MTMRKIPATMATQHPDNACAPYWATSPSVSTLNEVEECFRVFSDLDCDEYMWDWEGKFVDEAVVDRLFNRYAEYFKKKQLGRNKFLTFRVPNIWLERGIRLARSFMTILTAAHTAQDFRLHTPPIFEVILPMTTSADQLIGIVEKFRRASKYEAEIFETKIMDAGKIEMIPLIEGSATLIESRPILLSYAKQHKKMFGSELKYIRPFIARSDPALDAGFVPATLSARAAISEYYRFEEETGIEVYPILGAGSIGFRGGLAPDNLDRFFELYGGIRTVTLQSAFRYDYPQDEVKSAIRKLNLGLPKLTPVHFDPSDIETIMTLNDLFAEHYRPVIVSLSKTINELAKYVPQHRERIPHTGHFGYSRKVGKSHTHLPRAITFTSTLISLGIPPDLIGTGRGLKAAVKQGLEKKLARYLPGLEKDLIAAGHWLNWENLKFLIRDNPAWDRVLEDVKFIEEFLGRRLEPQTPEHFIHRNFTSNIYQLWRSQKTEALTPAILQAAVVRKSLG